MVLIRTQALRRRVVVACPRAVARGVLPDMSLAEAQALCPGLVHIEHEPVRDARALEALARWMMRFSPSVCIQESDTLALDITGNERLFHGIDSLIAQIRRALDRFGLTHSLAIAPTLGAAWALARFGETTSGAAPEDMALRLGALPVAALRLDEATVQCFADLGIDTIGQLAELPRASLPSRFGNIVLNRLDQAAGRLAEPLVPLVDNPPVTARLDFDEPVEELELIWEIARHLLQSVMRQLMTRGCGARQMLLDFFPERRSFLEPAEPIRKTLLLSRPTCEMASLMNLLRCCIEGVKLRDGLVGMRLGVPSFERLGPRQLHLLEDQKEQADAEMDHLIERLRVRLGDEALGFVQRVESHLPERAFRYEGQPASAAVLEPPVMNVRPLRLLAAPVEIRCTSTPSDELDGYPAFFTCESGIHRVIHCAGPERINGIWWEGRDKTRDYFDVEDEQGQRFWIFRVAETRKWYLHGEFD